MSQEEVQRLLDVAGASLPRLRVLTVICAKDHNLVKVYRISGTLVWEGSSTRRTVTRSTPWDDSPEACSEGTNHDDGRRDVPIRYSKLSPQRRFVIVGLLDEAATGPGDEPRGSCPCGIFGVSPGWLTGQLGHDDLPASRRVVVPADRQLK